MADVRLDFYDLDAEALPDVCMRCGEPSVVRPIKTFSWMPSWARMMPPIIAVFFVKRRRVPVPLCETHKNHWGVRYLVGLGGLALFLVLLVAGIALCASSEGDPDGPGTMVGIAALCLAGVVFIAWLIALIILAIGQINVFEITDDSIVMKNISPIFADAYREQMQGGPDVDDMARGQWARPAPGRRQDYDDPPHGRRPDYPRPPDDAFEKG